MTEFHIAKEKKDKMKSRITNQNPDSVDSLAADNSKRTSKRSYGLLDKVNEIVEGRYLEFVTYLSLVIRLKVLCERIVQ